MKIVKRIRGSNAAPRPYRIVALLVGVAVFAALAGAGSEVRRRCLTQRCPTRFSNGTRSPRTPWSLPARSKGRARSTWPTHRRLCTTRSSPSRAASSPTGRQSLRPQVPRSTRPLSKPHTRRSARTSRRHAIPPMQRAWRSASPCLPTTTRRLARSRPGTAKESGIIVGQAAASGITTFRTGDGRMTPIATTSSFETMDPGPGSGGLTPTAYAAPQTPWLGSVQPFLLKSPGQFKTEPPVPLTSRTWVRAFDEVKAYGKSDSTVRTDDQTATAYFYTANVIRQFNRAARDLATDRALGLLQTARLFAMVNAVSADALMSVLNQKYDFLFWRPVTAIDPTSVTADGFGPSPPSRDSTTATRRPSSRRAGGRSCRRPTTPSTREHTERTRQRWRRCSASSSVLTRSTSTFAVRPTSRGICSRCGTSTPRTSSAPMSRTPAGGAASTTALNGRGGAARTQGRSLRPQSRLQSDRLMLGREGRGLLHAPRRVSSPRSPRAHAPRPAAAPGCLQQARAPVARQ